MLQSAFLDIFEFLLLGRVLPGTKDSKRSSAASSYWQLLAAIGQNWRSNVRLRRLHDLTSADFSNTCEVFDPLLQDFQQSLHEIDGLLDLMTTMVHRNSRDGESQVP